MRFLKGLGVVLGLVLAGLTLRSVVLHSRDLEQAKRAWARLAEGAVPEVVPFDPVLVADMPEVARRYFVQAITPGTPLHRTVQLTMGGQFVLNGKAMPMRARQLLASPDKGFVWEAEIGSGAMRFAGSDGYLAGAAAESWTKFWLAGLVPMAREGGTGDHARAALTRAMMESIWAPANLLPQNGAVWRQIGPDSAEISFKPDLGVPPMQVTFDKAGLPTEVVALRWSNANADKAWRLQPFGGRILAVAGFQGFTIPIRVEMGNHFGTDKFDAFYQAEISGARFGPG